MMKDYTIIEEMSCTNWKERGLSLLISLSFHVLALFLLIKIFQPVKVYLYRKVADVRIVEHETMYLPRIAGIFEAQTSEVQTSGPSSRQKPVAGLPVQETKDVPSPEPVPGVLYLKNIAIAREIEPTAQSFDLIPFPAGKGDFSLKIGREKPEFEKQKKEDIHNNPDFSRFNESALSSLHFNHVVTGKGKAGNPGRMDIPDQLAGYDLSPWVREVVDKIRNRWTPPPIEESIAMGEVKILVIIGRGGDLVSMEILSSSDFQVFDHTTLAAVRESAPFPPLPADFPLDRLEAFLVFEFHE